MNTELIEFGFKQRPIIFCILHGLVLIANIALPFTDQYHWMVPVMSFFIELIYWTQTNKTFKKQLF